MDVPRHHLDILGRQWKGPTEAYEPDDEAGERLSHKVAPDPTSTQNTESHENRGKTLRSQTISRPRVAFIRAEPAERSSLDRAHSRPLRDRGARPL